MCAVEIFSALFCAFWKEIKEIWWYIIHLFQTWKIAGLIRLIVIFLLCSLLPFCSLFRSQLLIVPYQHLGCLCWYLCVCVCVGYANFLAFPQQYCGSFYPTQTHYIHSLCRVIIFELQLNYTPFTNWLLAQFFHTYCTLQMPIVLSCVEWGFCSSTISSGVEWNIPFSLFNGYDSVRSFFIRPSLHMSQVSCDLSPFHPFTLEIWQIIQTPFLIMRKKTSGMSRV